MRKLVQAILISLTTFLSGASYPDIVNYAIVNPDGTMKVDGRIVHLYGIYIPPTDYTCLTIISPRECAPRAVLQLNFKVGSRFVHCDRQWTNDDRSITAICTIDGEDLGAWMLSQGWAVALPDAPFEYQTLERIARTREIGVWGFPVDPIGKRIGKRKHR